MRHPATLLTAALALASLGAPALAQVQQGSPNAANQSMGNAAQTRTMQQNQVGQSNTTMMNAERGRTAAPPPSGGQLPGGTIPAPGSR